ncbi:uncharacterized protein LOC111917893 [Lactuca sativa]|uniref:C2H2-type domain-containing protein n=1 Tax=Lactuca sativa TaxID=4236 RepID=A0A9R1VYR5_LACSA|nr:uncharacterized protein LOC111917893 [Lactuca sativa]KAJ0214019.1 hypothetical protein LSAT_V11C400217050 [Lactuca sativa]
MIKRRFYKQEHGDKDVPSDSSSSSESELDAEASVDTDEEEEENNDNMVMESRKKDHHSSSSSGYESEDGSADEATLDSSGLLTNDDVISCPLSSENNLDMNNTHNINKEAIKSDLLDCVLKSKSVFKCKLCPRIVCLTEETLKAHLQSKRHSRSVKLLKEGRLKMMLDSDGEIEGETHQERHAATLALAMSKKNEGQDLKKNKGRQRQRKRLKKKETDDLVPAKTKKSAKKRRKSDV